MQVSDVVWYISEHVRRLSDSIAWHIAKIRNQRGWNPESMPMIDLTNNANTLRTLANELRDLANEFDDLRKRMEAA